MLWQNQYEISELLIFLPSFECGYRNQLAMQGLTSYISFPLPFHDSANLLKEHLYHYLGLIKP